MHVLKRHCLVILLDWSPTLPGFKLFSVGSLSYLICAQSSNQHGPGGSAILRAIASSDRDSTCLFNRVFALRKRPRQSIASVLSQSPPALPANRVWSGVRSAEPRCHCDPQEIS